MVMIKVNIRRQGGAAIMTIPSDVLKRLNVDVGASLELDVNDRAFTARPAHQTGRRRYSLVDLLRGVTPRMMSRLNAGTAWAREGKPVRREVA
jgi:antitoxin ChpS